MSIDKVANLDEVISRIKDGDSIVIGGWGDIRKPMALVKAIAKSSLKDLTILSCAAFDLDLLIGMGKVKKAIFPFVAFDGGAPGRAPNFVKARQEGVIEMNEMDEYMFCSQFKAAAERIPFYPVRGGIGTDILTINPYMKTICDPYSHETLLAVPSYVPDHALIHVNEADKCGNGRIIGDSFFDSWYAKAARNVIVSCERIVPVGELQHGDILSIYVDDVVETPSGAHPGSCYPEYSFDSKACASYVEAAANPEVMTEYVLDSLS